MNTYRGFTLIELLVAISLATIITLLGVSLMRTSINSSVANEEALIKNQAVRDARRFVEYAWSGRQATGFNVGEGQIEFISGRKDLGSSPLRFACQAAERGNYALWYYSASPADRELPPEERTGEMLLGDLGVCKFGFLQAPPDDKKPAQWKDDWPAGQDPPVVIRLDLATARGSLPPFIFTVGQP